MQRTRAHLAVAAVWILFIGLGKAHGMTVDTLRCDLMDSPLNVDEAAPRLSWVVHSEVQGDSQSAYEISVVGDGPKDEIQPLFWESGKIDGGQTSVAYAGKPIQAMQGVWWSVRVWDRDGKASEIAYSRFQMGMRTPADWKAKWITRPAGPATRPMPVFRKEFLLNRSVEKATIYICGLGQFQLDINGSKIGKDELTPGWTDYRKTRVYCAYDVTSAVKQGDNAIGVMLGNGMYNIPAVGRTRYAKFQGSMGEPMLILQLHLKYSGVDAEDICSDETWRVADGPITFTSIYGGEDEDARRLSAKWDTAGFDDSAWANAVVTTAGGAALVGSSHDSPPVRVAQTFTPVKVTQGQAGVWVYDLGQNCSMVPQITVQGKAGDAIRLTPAELLGANGKAVQGQSGSPAFDTFTLVGSDRVSWRPHFTYYGSRYIQVEGAVPAGEANPDQKPVISDVKGLFVTSAGAPAGTFTCSNKLFNRTAKLIDYAIRSNTVSLLTDCPHRERLGWLEQDHLMGPSLMYSYDMNKLMEKISSDMNDDQIENGLVPNIAPEYTKFPGAFRDSPEWGSASVLVPWQIYTWYGDKQALADHYEMMQKYVAYLQTQAKDNIVDYGLGDWYDLGPKPPGRAQLTPIALTATAFYYEDTHILQKTATVLGKNEEAAKYEAQAAAIRESFNTKFYDAQQHRYATGSQTADGMPLAMGIAPEADRAAIVADLVEGIHKNDDKLTAGDVGFRYLLRALAEGGQSQLIYDMNTKGDQPGYAMQLEKGATSLTEAWDAGARSSQDHFMLGHILEWFYADVAGISQTADSVGFEHIVIRPNIVGGMTSASATYESVRGPISVSWKLESGAFAVDVKIPAGADAQILLPGTMQAQTVQSGHYSFHADFISKG